MRKIMKKYKIKMSLILFVVLFSIIFPFSITMNSINLKKKKIYKPEMIGKSILINSEKIDIEMFVPLVLYSIMSDAYEEETLKSMMIIIRTYIIYKMGNDNSIDVENLGLPYTTYSELEKNWGSDYENEYGYTMKLLKATNKKIIKYNEEVIYPYYHELSAGVTNIGEYEYLKSVESEWDTKSENYESVLYFTGEKICENLKEKYNIEIENNDLTNQIKINMEENNKYVRSVTVGETAIEIDEFAKLFELPSTAFIFESFEGEYKVTTYGRGNGKGLSIYGAEKMSEEGKKYDEILNYFYNGIEIVNLN